MSKRQSQSYMTLSDTQPIPRMLSVDKDIIWPDTASIIFHNNDNRYQIVKVKLGEQVPVNVGAKLFIISPNQGYTLSVEHDNPEQPRQCSATSNYSAYNANQSQIQVFYVSQIEQPQNDGYNIIKAAIRQHTARNFVIQYKSELIQGVIPCIPAPLQKSPQNSEVAEFSHQNDNQVNTNSNLCANDEAVSDELSGQDVIPKLENTDDQSDIVHSSQLLCQHEVLNDSVFDILDAKPVAQPAEKSHDEDNQPKSCECSRGRVSQRRMECSDNAATIDEVDAANQRLPQKMELERAQLADAIQNTQQTRKKYLCDDVHLNMISSSINDVKSVDSSIEEFNAKNSAINREIRELQGQIQRTLVKMRTYDGVLMRLSRINERMRKLIVGTILALVVFHLITKK